MLSNHATADMRRTCLQLGADRVFDRFNEIDALAQRHPAAAERQAAADA